MSPFVFIQAGGLQGEAKSLTGPPAAASAALMKGIRAAVVLEGEVLERDVAGHLV